MNTEFKDFEEEMKLFKIFWERHFINKKRNFEAARSRKMVK